MQVADLKFSKLAAIAVLMSGGLEFISPTAFAQANIATVYGTVVTDSPGAVVPRATINLVNEDTGQRTTKIAEESGAFGFTFVPAGSYTLRIDAAGFRSFVNKGVSLTAGQQMRPTFSLEVVASRTSGRRYGYNRTIQERIDGFFDIVDPKQPNEATALGRRLPRLSTTLGWSGRGGEINHSGGPLMQLDKDARYAGRHALKFGGNFFRSTGTRNNAEIPGFFYASLANMLANGPSEVVSTRAAPEHSGSSNYSMECAAHFSNALRCKGEST